MVALIMSDHHFLDSFPIQKRLLTADEVLSALQQRLDYILQLRQKPPMLLTKSFLIQDWALLPDNTGWLGAIAVCTSDFWYDVAEMLKQQFVIDLPENVLASFLRRPRGTLGDMCNVIAQHADPSTACSILEYPLTRRS